MKAAEELGQDVGVVASCKALGVSRATLYRRRKPPQVQPPETTAARPRSHRALTDEERARVLGTLNSARFADQAPVFVVLLAKIDFVAGRLGRQIQGVPYNLLDIGIAAEHFVLQAEELGLRTCWIGWFDVRKAKKLLEIPRKYKVVAMLSLGYSDKRPPRDPSRKPLEEIAWFNRVGG